jgi:hypothetical protein
MDFEPGEDVRAGDCWQRKYRRGPRLVSHKGSAGRLLRAWAAEGPTMIRPKSVKSASSVRQATAPWGRSAGAGRPTEWRLLEYQCPQQSLIDQPAPDGQVGKEASNRRSRKRMVTARSLPRQSGRACPKARANCNVRQVHPVDGGSLYRSGEPNRTLSPAQPLPAIGAAR